MAALKLVLAAGCAWSACESAVLGSVTVLSLVDASVSESFVLSVVVAVSVAAPACLSSSLVAASFVSDAELFSEELSDASPSATSSAALLLAVTIRDKTGSSTIAELFELITLLLDVGIVSLLPSSIVVSALDNTAFSLVLSAIISVVSSFESLAEAMVSPA